MAVGIISVSSAVPKHSLSQEESFAYAKMYSRPDMRQSRMLEDLYKRTSILRRSSVILKNEEQRLLAPEFFPIPIDAQEKGPSTAKRMQMFAEHAALLSQQACEKAIDSAGVGASEITHLVTASCTGFNAPGFDIQLVDLLSLKRNIYRTHIGFMGCHAGLNALRLAESYCLADSRATVLVCATELCSIHFQYGLEKNDVIANSLFADGSAALIVRNVEKSHIQYAGSISYIVPDSLDAITWQISDHGFVMTLSSSVKDLIQEHLPSLLTNWLQKFSLNVDDIKSWIVHPGGPKIIDAVQNSLQMPAIRFQESRQVLAEYGNMSSPTVFFILQNLLAKKSDAPYAMLAFGPGLTIEAALFI